MDTVTLGTRRGDKLFVISRVWLTSHLRSTLFPLDIAMPGTNRRDTVSQIRMLIEKLNLIKPNSHG